MHRPQQVRGDVPAADPISRRNPDQVSAPKVTRLARVRRTEIVEAVAVSQSTPLISFRNHASRSRATLPGALRCPSRIPTRWTAVTERRPRRDAPARARRSRRPARARRPRRPAVDTPRTAVGGLR
jgi:hypothetical protein